MRILLVLPLYLAFIFSASQIFAEIRRDISGNKNILRDRLVETIFVAIAIPVAALVSLGLVYLAGIGLGVAN